MSSSSLLKTQGRSHVVSRRYTSHSDTLVLEGYDHRKTVCSFLMRKNVGRRTVSPAVFFCSFVVFPVA